MAKALGLSLADVQQAVADAMPVAERELFPRIDTDFSERLEALLRELDELSCAWAAYEIPQGRWTVSGRYYEITLDRLRNIIEAHWQSLEQQRAQTDREIGEL